MSSTVGLQCAICNVHCAMCITRLLFIVRSLHLECEWLHLKTCLYDRRLLKNQLQRDKNCSRNEWLPVCCIGDSNVSPGGIGITRDENRRERVSPARGKVLVEKDSSLRIINVSIKKRLLQGQSISFEVLKFYNLYKSPDRGYIMDMIFRSFNAFMQRNTLTMFTVLVDITRYSTYDNRNCLLKKNSVDRVTKTGLKTIPAPLLEANCCTEQGFSEISVSWTTLCNKGSR